MEGCPKQDDTQGGQMVGHLKFLGCAKKKMQGGGWVGHLEQKDRGLGRLTSKTFRVSGPWKKKKIDDA